MMATAAVMLASCGDQSDDTPGGPGHEGSDPLAGHDYIAVEVSGERDHFVDDTEVTLSFADGEVRARAGCNTFTGNYELRYTEGPADGPVRLVVDSMGGTEMGCPEELMAQDDWLVEFLTSEPSLSVSGADEERLGLNGAEATMTLMKKEFVVPQAELVGTDWRVLSLGDDDAAVSSPSTITEAAWIHFEDDGTYGFKICNTGSGEYEVDGDTIEFTGGMQTMMACENALGDLEDEFTRLVRSDSVTWSIDGDTLRLDDGQGSGLVLIAGDDSDDSDPEPTTEG